MSKRIHLAAMLVAGLGLLITSADLSAQCDSCGNVGVDVGAYPKGGGGAGGAGGCAGEFKAKLAHTAAINGRIAARNEAWPKPFACSDRQLMFATFRPMIDAGYEDQNILSSTHFDPETGELTKYGIQQVGGIMMNMPQHRRQVFVQAQNDPAKTQDRVAKVQQVISTYYGHRSGTVEVSSRNNVKLSGVTAETITRLRLESFAPPIIPTPQGNESLSSSINSN